MEQLPIGGKQVHDANIVATHVRPRIGRLLTANTGDFARFAHLITVVSLEAGREAPCGFLALPQERFLTIPQEPPCTRHDALFRRDLYDSRLPAEVRP